MNLARMVRQLSVTQRPLPEYDPMKPVTGVTHDSRDVTAGDVFVAVCGFGLDGHDYAEQAAARGAAAIVVERPLQLAGRVPVFLVRDTRRALAALSDAFHGHPSRRLRVLAASGTNGKTTICQLVRAIIRAAGHKIGVLGTLGYDTGLRVVPAGMTTPDATDTQRYLREMVEEGCAYAAMEVSSHALVQRRVDFVHFFAAAFSNLSQDHLDLHGSMKNYREAKALLFDSLGPASFAVLNAEDKTSLRFAQRANAAVIWYGVEGARACCAPVRPPQVRARVHDIGLDGSSFELITPEGAAAVNFRLAGRHNILNALAAAGLALAAGIDTQTIADGLSAAEIVDGRLHAVVCGQPWDCAIDYAHTHHAMQTVLKAVRPHVKGEILLVFGAGGDRDRGKRPKMGRVAERCADTVWLTSDNPRSEDPMDIIREVLSGAQNPERFRVQPDRERAIAEALRAAQENDMVLILGKGHERTQIFKDSVVPFDDREIARRIMVTELGYGKATERQHEMQIGPRLRGSGSAAKASPLV